MKNSIITKLILAAGLVVGMSFVSGCATNTSSGDQMKPMKPMKGGEHLMMLNKGNVHRLNPPETKIMMTKLTKLHP